MNAAVFAISLLLQASNDKLPSPKTTPELQSAIQKVLAEHKTNGIALALASRDAVTLAWSYGTGQSGPVTAATRFRIGSTSKSFTALAALQLVEQGKLSLDAKYRDLAPEIPFENPWEATDPVRIAHLLEHTSGNDDYHLAEYAHSDPNPISLKDGLLFHPQSRHSRWRPGSRFSYSNSGPPMVAYVIEKLTGERFEDYVQKHFFDPIGMPGATFFEPRGDFAGTYLNEKLQPYWHVIQRPAGSINATASDMGNYVRFFLNRGAGIVRPESIERMEVPQTLLANRATGLRTGYALHNYTSYNEGFLLHGHNGGVNGALAELAYSPELGLGYAFMINSGSGPALKDISTLVGRFLFRNIAKPVPRAASQEPQPLTTQAVWLEPASPRAELFHFLERIAGLARAHADGNKLIIAPLLGKPETFYYLGANRYRGEKSPAADLAFVIDDGIESLQSTAFGPTFHRIPAWLAWVEVICAGGFVLSFALTLLGTPVWIYRWLKGRILTPAVPARIVASATALLLVAIVLTPQIADTDFELLGMLGRPTIWSAGVMGLTILFAIFGLLNFWVASKSKQARIFAKAAGLFLFVGVIYFAWWGWIGIRTWNY
jgi:CubicO group peptidase (beta-lactamase class C family)